MLYDVNHAFLLFNHGCPCSSRSIIFPHSSPCSFIKVIFIMLQHLSSLFINLSCSVMFIALHHSHAFMMLQHFKHLSALFERFCCSCRLPSSSSYSTTFHHALSYFVAFHNALSLFVISIVSITLHDLQVFEGACPPNTRPRHPPPHPSPQLLLPKRPATKKTPAESKKSKWRKKQSPPL